MEDIFDWLLAPLFAIAVFGYPIWGAVTFGAARSMEFTPDEAGAAALFWPIFWAVEFGRWVAA